MTEVIPHPAAGDPDDREMYVAAGQPIDATPSAVLVGGPDYDAEPDVISCGATREVGVQVLENSLSSLFF